MRLTRTMNGIRRKGDVESCYTSGENTIKSKRNVVFIYIRVPIRHIIYVSSLTRHAFDCAWLLFENPGDYWFVTNAASLPKQPEWQTMSIAHQHTKAYDTGAHGTRSPPPILRISAYLPLGAMKEEVLLQIE